MHFSARTWTQIAGIALLAQRAEGAGHTAASDSYDGCVYDPESGNAFQLIDSTTYVPIIKENTHISLDHDYTSKYLYHVSRPEGTQKGVYDITTEVDGISYYMAIYEDERLGWATKSSQGQDYVEGESGRKYVTTAFSVRCMGRVVASIDGHEYNFAVDTNDYVTVETLPAARRRQAVTASRGFIVVPVDASLQKNAFPRDVFEDPSRCSPGQTSVKKNPPVFTAPNGCGAQGGDFDPPDFNFGDCCNEHDLCFDDCVSTFDQCNDRFLRCMRSRCDRDFDGGLFVDVANAGCKAVAETFSVAVKAAGAEAFRSATQKHCDCKRA